MKSLASQTQKVFQDFNLLSVIKKLIPIATFPTLNSNTSFCEQYLSTLKNFRSSWLLMITPSTLCCIQNTLSNILSSIDLVPSEKGEGKAVW